MTRRELCSRINEAKAAWSRLGEFTYCELYGSGHINDTFLAVSKTGKRYIMQRINNTVFSKPERIMENIVAVTEHIVKKTGDARSTLSVVKTDAGENFFRDSIGSYWRIYDFCENTVSRNAVTSKDEFSSCAEAFGRFQGQLSDFDATQLYEAIRDFHNTEKRFENLVRAIESDVCGRAASVKKEIEFALSRKEFASTLENARRDGSLPVRVTHNDTKLNNILFDAETGEPVCIIDLDTVMPGYSVNDFGDAIRFGANAAAEDERDLSKVKLDLTLYLAYAEGFVRGCDGKLTKKELELLPVGARMMTFECGMRFLTDYLEGDTYFRTSREGHNLDRCRCQFALVADMEKKESKMNII